MCVKRERLERERGRCVRACVGRIVMGERGFGQSLWGRMEGGLMGLGEGKEAEKGGE